MRMLFALLFMTTCATAHEHGQDPDGWFRSLMNKRTMPCCNGQDAKHIDDVDWESKDGHYRVRLDGKWIDVPDESVIDGPNRLGPAMVWPWKDPQGRTQIRCFMPGAGT